MRFFIILSILFLSMYGDDKKVECPKKEKVITLFENNYEKIFEFKDKIYRIIKGNERKDAILMILDESRMQYIKIGVAETSD